MLGGLATGVNVGLQNLQAARAAQAGAQAGAQTGALGPVVDTAAAPAAALGETVSTQSLAGLGGPAATAYAAPAATTAATVPGTGVLQPALLGTDAASRAAQAAAASGSPTSTGFLNALRAGGNAILDRVTDPVAAAQLVLQASGLMSAEGLSSEEQALLAEQQEYLNTLREQDQAAFNAQMSAAQALLAEAGQVDPEREGRQRAALMQQRTGRAMQEQERAAGLRPGAGGMGSDVALRARQNLLLGQQAAESAFQGGQQTAQQQRTSLTQAAASAFPRGAPMGAFQGGLTQFNMLGTDAQRRADSAAAQGAMFDQFRGALGIDDWWDERRTRRQPGGT